MAANLKRSLEATGAENGTTKKMKGDEGFTDELSEIRVLIDNFEASVIIGKGGCNVKQVRVDSGAFVSILKTDSSTPKERVMTVKGKEESIAKAMHLMFGLLLESANTRKRTNDPEAAPDEEFSMKILIHKFLAGSIIGKGGAIIKEMQETTKTRITLSNDVLPNSTEKTVTIHGNSDGFFAAVTRVLNQVLSNPLRPGSTTIPFVPGAPDPSMGPGYGGMAPGYGSYGAPPSQGMYGAPQGYGADPYAAHGQYGGQGYGSGSGHYGGGGGAPGHPPAGPPGSSKTEKIVIPTICAGIVIGKGGTVISDIKRQSGTQINIAAASESTPEDRVVSIVGSPAGIQTAIYMIRQRVESYRPQ